MSMRRFARLVARISSRVTGARWPRRFSAKRWRMAELKIHPTAARFPRLSKEQLAVLAADIKEHGLQQKIVLTADSKTLVDGINRRAACELAGVEPTFRHLPERYTQVDIIRFIISANLRRRDLNPGQRALLSLDAGEIAPPQVGAD